MQRTLYKTVYFVRHGESEGNEKAVHQSPQTPLTEKGRVQAGFMAKRFESIPIDIVVSSTLERARETAAFIAKQIGHDIVYSELFQEVRRPSMIMGKGHDDPEAAKIIKEIKKRYTDESWRHSDEENFVLLKARALQALRFILDRPEKNILVVTHGEILCAMMSAMAFDDSLTADIFQKLNHNFATSNTGITKVEYSNFGWYVITWNDNAHLGEVK